jgi:SAM-dependent methyltransferase
MSVLSCPACLGENFKERELIPRLLSVKICVQCGLLINDSKYIGQAGYERVNDVAYEMSIGLVRRQQAKDVTAFVRQYQLTKKGYWLDIGCGTGNLLKEVLQMGYQVLGVEPDVKAYKQACSLVGTENVYLGLMDYSVAPNQSFDVVSTLDVLEHIPPEQLADFARLIYSKLKPGGIWVIKVPSKDGLYFKVAHKLVRLVGSPLFNVIKRLWLIDYQAPHTVYFNKESLHQYLGLYHFQSIAQKYLDEIPNNTVVDRMLVDSSISRYQAYLFAPGFYLVNFIERQRGCSDALLLLAQRLPGV